MEFPYYRTDKKRLNELPPDLTLPPISRNEKNRTYIVHPDLADAVNVAALLGQPLLVTGEPGTGKTELAYNINWQLGFVNPAPFSFETKSTSMAKICFILTPLSEDFTPLRPPKKINR